MEKTKSTLKEMVKLPGIPGREEAVIKYLMNFPIEAAERKTDISGNTWIRCKGASEASSIILAAHMDEVGCRVKKIEEDGQVSVIGLENLDMRTMAGQIFQVRTEKGVYDAYVYVNQKTVRPDNYNDLKGDDLRLDLGLTSKKETEKLGIQPNDPVTFGPEYYELQNHVVCAKAFDNRCSLTAMLRGVQLSEGKRKLRPVILGTVQEEIGGHGAKAVEFAEKPGAVLIFDICGAEVFRLSEKERRTIMGKGPILLNHPGTNMGLYKRLKYLAAKDDIPVQEVGYYWRGADPSIFQQKCGGLATMTIIIPMAYYHAPKGLISVVDVYETARLISAALQDEDFVRSVSAF